MPNLAPGSYHVVFEGESYQPTVYRTLTLNAGARGIVDAVLGSPGVTPVTLTAHLNYSGEFGQNIAFDRRRLPAAMVARDEMRKDGARLAGKGGSGCTAEWPSHRRHAEPADERENKEDDGGGGGPRVRSFFPETLYTNPSLITDGQGRATIHVPMADSITTWRVTSLASTTRGALGSSTAPIRVFQDFFVDLDLPVSLTEGDVVSVPVAVYNYLPKAQTVSLELRQDPWFALDNDNAVKQIEVKAGEVTSVSFRVKASKIGEQQFQVTARLIGAGANQPGDAVARSVNVLPNGEEHAVVVNERLEGSVTKDVVIPAGAIARCVEDLRQVLSWRVVAGSRRSRFYSADAGRAVSSRRRRRLIRTSW